MTVFCFLSFTAHLLYSPENQTKLVTEESETRLKNQ